MGLFEITLICLFSLFPLYHLIRYWALLWQWNQYTDYYKKRTFSDVFWESQFKWHIDINEIRRHPQEMWPEITAQALLYKKEDVYRVFALSENDVNLIASFQAKEAMLDFLYHPYHDQFAKFCMTHEHDFRRAVGFLGSFYGNRMMEYAAHQAERPFTEEEKQRLHNWKRRFVAWLT